MKPLSSLSLSIIASLTLYAQTISLDEGWNLIGIGSESSFEALKESNEAITSLFTYRERQWHTSGAIYPYDGIWAKASETTSLYISTSTRGSTRVDSLSLEEGWNLVSLPVDSTLTPRVFTNAKSVYKYSEGSWELYSGESASDYPGIDYIGSGEGFWVNNRTDETILISDAESDYSTFDSTEAMEDYLNALARFHNSYQSNQSDYYDYPVYILEDGADYAPGIVSSMASYSSEASYISGTDDSSNEEVTDVTSTNTQEEDVDEADILKHDGENIFYLSSSGQQIYVTTFSAILAGETEAQQVIDVDRTPQQLYLINDKLIAIYPYNYSYWTYWDMAATSAYSIWSNTSTIDIYDVSDLDSITLTDTFSFDGNIVDTRITNGQLYVVDRYMPYIEVEYPKTVTTECYTYDYYYSVSTSSSVSYDSSHDSTTGAASSSSSVLTTSTDSSDTILSSQATQTSASLVEDDEDSYLPETTYYCNCDEDGDGQSESYCSYDYSNPIELESYVIPQVTHNGTATDLFGSSTLYAPAKLDQSPYITSIFTVDLSDLTQKESIASVGNSTTLYASNQSIYTVSQDYPLYYDWESYEERSTVYRFGITDGLSFDGKAFVPGRIQSQFNLSEHNDILRIATTTGWSWSDDDTDNGVYTIQKSDDGLELIGSLTGLGKPGETITGVRFLGDRGFMSTFEFKDPLYTIDLSDPTNPAVAGQLDEIPGYSSYFHPISDDLLLSVGLDADDDGNQLGIQLQLFDISDFSAPTLADRVIIGDSLYYSSEATYNHKAFTFRDSDYLMALPISHYSFDYSDECKEDAENDEGSGISTTAYCSWTYSYESNLSLYQIDSDTKQFQHVDELTTEKQSYSNQRSIIFSSGDTDYAVFFNGDQISFKALSL